MSSFPAVSKAAAYRGRAAGEEKIPAQPHDDSLRFLACGAESVPRKKRGEPEVAASRTALRCRSRFKTGKQ